MLPTNEFEGRTIESPDLVLRSILAKTPPRVGNPKTRFRQVARFWSNPATAGLSHASQAVWFYLWYLADQRGICFPSIRKVAARVGCSNRHVQSAVKALKDRGFLKVLRTGSNRGRNRANIYRVTLPMGETECAYQWKPAAP